MGYLKFKLADGTFFHAKVGTIRGVKPHKRPNKAIVLVTWSDKHSYNPTNGNIREMVAVGDWKKLKGKWRNLAALG